MDDIDPDSLDEMSRDELLSLARRLTRSARGGAGSRRPRVNPDDVASSVEEALDHEREPLHYTMSRDIGCHTDRAHSDLRERRWEDAVRGATGVIQGFAKGYDPGFDPEGDLTYDLGEAIEAVDASLRHVKSERFRRKVFDALMELWWADIRHGGVGLSDDVPNVLRKHASKAERARLATRVKERLPGGGGNWRRETAARLFLELGGDQLDDEAYLTFCRTNGLHMERVERLLSLGRTEEAARAAKDVPHYRLTEAADLLVKARRPELAVGVVRDRLGNPDAKRFYDPLKEWLQRRAEKENDLPQARRLAWERFRERPSIETHTSLRKVARRAKSWPADEREALAFLRQAGHGDLLTEVHLAERRVAEALRCLKALPRRFPFETHDDLKRRVADAARREFPGAARDLYLELADRLIARKTRHYYAQAAPLVKAACALDKQVHGRAASGVLRKLRRRYEGLPALWDELRKARVKAPQ